MFGRIIRFSHPSLLILHRISEVSAGRNEVRMTSEVDTDSSPAEYAVYHSILEGSRQHSRNIHMYFFVFFKFKTGSFICSIIDIRFSRLTAQITGSQNVFLSVLNKMCPALPKLKMYFMGDTLFPYGKYPCIVKRSGVSVRFTANYY